MIIDIKGFKALVKALKSQTDKKMDVESYDPEAKGSVLYADNIYGSYTANPLMYYGTNTLGDVGFHFIPVQQVVSNSIEQRTALNVKANEQIYVPLSDSTFEAKTLVEVYKFVQGENNVVATIKTFDNSQQESFFFDKDKVSFEKAMKIKDNYEYAFVENLEHGFYETEEIDFSEFLEIESLSTGGNDV